MRQKQWPGDEPPAWARELINEMRAVRKAIEVQQAKLVRGTEAARMLGMHPVSFYKKRPVPPTYVPGETGPRYSVAKINALIEEWTGEG